MIGMVVQFWVLESLAVWVQRAGRAARDPDIEGLAVLLVEKSVYKLIKKRKDVKGMAQLSDASDSEEEEEIYYSNNPLLTGLANPVQKNDRTQPDQRYSKYQISTRCIMF